MAYANDIVKGMEIVRALADLLNAICKSEGGIRRNDPRIWDDYLHKLTEQEWHQIITVLEAFRDHEPSLLRGYDVDNINRARRSLNKAIAQDKSFVGQPNNPKSGNKHDAWATIMSMREIVNRNTGIYIANRPGDIEDLADYKATNTYSQIFE